MPYPTPKEIVQRTPYSFAVSHDTMLMIQAYFTAVKSGRLKLGEVLQKGNRSGGVFYLVTAIESLRSNGRN